MRCGAGGSSAARWGRGHIRRGADSAKCHAGGSPHDTPGICAGCARGGADAATLIGNYAAGKPAARRFPTWERAESTEQRSSEPSGARESTWK